MTEDKALPIAQVLAAVSKEIGAVKKDSTAPNQIGGFNFRGVDAVVNAVHPALAKHQVFVQPQVVDVFREVVTSGGGRAMKVVTVTTDFTFHGPAGDSLTVRVLGEASDAGDKATSKAQSVALRVALLQALMLPTDEPDPDTHNFERQAQPPQQQYGGGDRWGGPNRGEDGSTAGRPAEGGVGTPPARPAGPGPLPQELQDEAQALAVKALSRRTVNTLAEVHKEAAAKHLLRVVVRVPEGEVPLHEVIADKKQMLLQAQGGESGGE